MNSWEYVKIDCHEPGNDTGQSKKRWVEFIKEILAKFNPKEFFKYGWARPIHYVSSLLVMGLITAYVCIMTPVAIAYVVLSLVMFMLIGMVTPGVYNKDYSLDVNNKTWIFFMEVVTFLQLFIFVWFMII